MGWVGSHPYLKLLWIEVRRGDHIIAEAQAQQASDGSRFQFVVQVGDAISGKEFLDQSVHVVALSANGDRGVLLPDGATQLELIRKFLGPPSESIVDIDFAEGGNSCSFAREGWSPPGPTYTLALGDDSVLELPPIRKPGRHLLRILSGALIVKPHVPHQSLTIFLNEAALSPCYFEITDPKFVEIAFDATPFVGCGSVIARLHHPDGFRPKDYFKNSEERIISLSMKRIEIVRLLNTSTCNLGI